MLFTHRADGKIGQLALDTETAMANVDDTLYFLANVEYFVKSAIDDLEQGD